MAKFAAIISGLREHGSHWFWRTVAVLVLAVLFFVAGGGVSQSDRWKVERVDISGAQAVESSAIEAFAREELKGNYYFVYARENSYLFPGREIEQGLLEMFPRLASARAEPIAPHAIAIKVSERKPYALWCGTAHLETWFPSEPCWFIDDTGFVFDRAPIFSDGVYVAYYSTLEGARDGDVLRAHIPASRFALMHDLMRALAREGNETLRIEAKPEGEMTLTMKKSTSYPVLAGVELRFKDAMNAEAITKNLLAALPVQFPDGTTPKKKLLYIDMRFGNKIFFGFEN